MRPRSWTLARLMGNWAVGAFLEITVLASLSENTPAALTMPAALATLDEGFPTGGVGDAIRASESFCEDAAPKSSAAPTFCSSIIYSPLAVRLPEDSIPGEGRHKSITSHCS